MTSKCTTRILLLFIAVFSLSGYVSGETLYEPGTFLRDWLLLGPFPNCRECAATDYHHDTRCTGFYTDYLQATGGEKNTIPREGLGVQVPGGDESLEWTALRSEEDIIHLSEILVPKDMVVAYAFTQVESPEDQEVILSVGSNDGARVFLNGQEVHESHEFNGRWLQSDNDFIPVTLKQGTNNLLLKIDQGTGDFGYAVRFLNHESVLRDLRKDIKRHQALTAVAIDETLVVSFGTAHKISVLNPVGKVHITLSHEEGGKFSEALVAPGKDALFPLRSMPEGFIQIEASFPTPEDGTITSETKYYKGKLKRHPRVGRMAADLTILDAAGKPFFPIGTYGAPVEEYKKLKEAGYNFVVAGAGDLDSVHEAGLLAAVSVHGSEPKAYSDYINKYKDHPAVLCWMLYDEPGHNKADLQFIYDIYNAAYEADKIHPSYLVITVPTVYRSFGPLCDVLAIDTYPVAHGAIESVGENIALAYEQLEREVPIWHCGQMFTWPNQRRPNPQEHRFMTYTAIMNGARGALWYTYKGYGQNLPVDDPALWNAQKVLLSELNELASLFLAPGFGKEIQPLSANEFIQAVVKESPIGTYLIVSNRSKTETFQPEFRVSGEIGKNITVHNEDRAVDVKNNRFADVFKPLDVHIYRLR